MTVYLIHFDQPYKHAKHYTGFTQNKATLQARLDHHREGTGARLMQVVTEAGIGWRCVRTWPNGTRTFERSLKGRGVAPLCPVCAGPAALKRRRK